jgi:chromosome segregation ATPase
MFDTRQRLDDMTERVEELEENVSKLFTARSVMLNDEEAQRLLAQFTGLIDVQAAARDDLREQVEENHRQLQDFRNILTDLRNRFDSAVRLP